MVVSFRRAGREGPLSRAMERTGETSVLCHYPSRGRSNPFASAAAPHSPDTGWKGRTVGEAADGPHPSLRRESCRIAWAVTHPIDCVHSLGGG